MTALSVTEVTLRNEIGVFADTPFQKPKADGFTWDCGEFWLTRPLVSLCCDPDPDFTRVFR